MSAEVLERLDARLASIEARIAPVLLKPVMSTREACAYVGLSDDGLRLWAARWRVLPCGHGRWPLHRLNAGLEREARQGERKPRKATVTA
jgi:hypothetical protein